MALSTSRTVVTQTGLSTGSTYNVGGVLVGTSNLHTVGIEIAGINVLGADTPIGSGSTIYDDGGARFSGVVTATSFSGSVAASQLTGALPAISGANLTGLPVSSEFNFGTTGITTTKNLGINTSTVDNYETVGAANSFRGIYIGDGSLIFNARLDNINGYYIGTGRNALNAGPVTLGSTMTLDGAWVIV